MNSIVEKFSEGRKIIRRISLEEMESVWNGFSEEYRNTNKKEDWIEAIKKPSWAPNTIWDEEEGNWIEFEDWLDFTLGK